MFVKQEIGVIQTNLSSQVDELKEKIQKLEANKEYLAKNLKESEDNLRELVAQKQKARAWERGNEPRQSYGRIDPPIGLSHSSVRHFTL